MPNIGVPKKYSLAMAKPDSCQLVRVPTDLLLPASHVCGGGGREGILQQLYP